jgi:hypothetical protein
MKFKILMIVLICIFAGYYLKESNDRKILNKSPVVIEVPISEHFIETTIKDIENVSESDWIAGTVYYTGKKAFMIDMMNDGEFSIFENGKVFRYKNNIDPRGKYATRIKKLYKKVEHWRCSNKQE